MTSVATQLAATTALRHMLNGRHFSICTIDKIVKAYGIHCDKQAYDTLSLLHCVDYNEMPPALLQALPQLIATCLQGLEIDSVTVESLLPRPPSTTHQEKDVTPEKQRGRLLRLLTRNPL